MKRKGYLAALAFLACFAPSTPVAANCSGASNCGDHLRQSNRDKERYADHQAPSSRADEDTGSGFWAVVGIGIGAAILCAATSCLDDSPTEKNNQ